ncbi:MAG: caspase family protein [Nostoc sp. TH1S01]|nr:caspase family protein [Nostoc sp. TH1S01]
MADWALVIGINNYQRLRSLKYAVDDAEEMLCFFEKAGFDNIFYFSDKSDPIPSFSGTSQESKPTYTNLSSFLNDFFEFQEQEDLPLQTGDNFWFFFSGHGIRKDGQDYLMPCDGNDRLIEKTAISIRYIIDRLSKCGADNIILLLDACRNENNLGDKSGGIRVPQKYPGVITIASCSPYEKSYEIDEIGHGSFTYALLEALQMEGECNCATVERLNKYLLKRVPEINQNYKKPLQNPYIVVEPLVKQHLILLPQQATYKDITILKNDALNNKKKGNLELAKQLLIRAFHLSNNDPNIQQALEEISQKIELRRKTGTPELSDSKSPILDKQTEVKLDTLIGRWKTYWSYQVTETEMEIFSTEEKNTRIGKYSFSFINNLSYVIEGNIYGELLDGGKVLKGRFEDETGSGYCSFYLSSDGSQFDGKWSDNINSNIPWTGKRIY